jgi:RND superfamily putative drug exporter
MGSASPPSTARGRAGLLGSVAALATRRPRLIVVAWLVSMGALGLAGAGLENDVSTQLVYVDGSAAKQAHEVAVREFGGEDALVLMLRGPRLAVNRQGRKLVDRLEAAPHTLAISPWNSRGSIAGLRPAPGVAAILVSVGRSPGALSPDTVPFVQHLSRQTVRRPVRISIAGGPAIAESMRRSIDRAATLGEKLAIPVLLIVLLLVCRSVLAAALPVVIGGFVVGATRGVLDLITGTIAIDSIALSAAAMLGLALGIDYSLLVVSRFREEMEKCGEVEPAVRETVVATGRSIIPAGFGLVLAMLMSLELIPGSFVASIALAVSAASILSVLSALLFVPAVLTLLGTRLDRWSLPRRHAGGSVLLAASRRISGRPGIVLGLIFALMLCGAWAFALDTKTGSVAELPASDPGRLQQEDIERELGPGWVAPFEIVMDGRGRPVTTPGRLRALAAFQRRVERDPGVVAMAGFAGLEHTTEQLSGIERSLATQQRGLTRLAGGIGRARDGAAATVDGLSQAASGAGRIDSAAGAIRAGSGLLSSGLRAGASGAARLNSNLGRASEGSGQLTAATSKASAGAGRLAAKIKQAREQASEAVSGARVQENAMHLGERSLTAVEGPLGTTEGQLAAAWQALQRMTSGRSDPQYLAAVEAVKEASRGLTGTDPGDEEGPSPAAVASGVEHAQNQFSLGIYLAERQAKSGRRARDGVNKLAQASVKLDHGLGRLLESSRRLSDGIARLWQGSEQISPGLRRLTAGAERLVGGLGKLATGAGGLAGGLAEGAQKSRRLIAGLALMRSRIEAQGFGPGHRSRLDRLREQSPGLFRSGYFYLAGLDGSSTERRNQAQLLVNLARGGTTARMLVIPSDRPVTAGATATGVRLTEDAADLARKTGTEVVVGGLSPTLVDLNTALRDRAPLARLVLSLVTILILIPVTRSLVLPIIAALLNLLTVSATFGLLAILFNGSLLGGPGFVEAVVIPASIVLAFGLAIDYEVFIFARMREEYLRTGSSAAAIENGLAQTGHVVSGAALIMIAVFLAFSVSSLSSIRNLGVAQAIGVFIDAFVIRFVILPAAMRALGDRSWWLPSWLDRILPGSSAGARRALDG